MGVVRANTSPRKLVGDLKLCYVIAIYKIVEYIIVEWI